LPTTGIGLSTSSINEPGLPDNFSLSGFMMEQEGFSGDGSQKVSLPPIPGIIIIPNNIGFLHKEI
jgi:hypothetical protein